jgi:hypothetical protein
MPSREMLVSSTMTPLAPHLGHVVGTRSRTGVSGISSESYTHDATPAILAGAFLVAVLVQSGRGQHFVMSETDDGRPIPI